MKQRAGNTLFFFLDNMVPSRNTDSGLNAMRIPVGPKHFAVVDESDAWVASIKWGISSVGRCHYAKNRKRGLMHRVIMGDPPTPGLILDHINHDGLDNRRCNLRWCTHRENVANRRSAQGKTSRFLGVHWEPARGCWRASCGRSQRRHRSELAAAISYDAMARSEYGEFANPNFPKLREPEEFLERHGMESQRKTQSVVIQSADVTPKDVMRFMSRVEKRDGCWIWNGGRSKTHGTCIFRFQAKSRVSQRFAVIAFTTKESLSSEEKIYTSCGNGMCVNPAHMLLAGNHLPVHERAAPYSDRVEVETLVNLAKKLTAHEQQILIDSLSHE